MSDQSSYSDKRKHRRHRKRFSLRFEECAGNGMVNGHDNGNGSGRLAFTEDFSRKGIFIKTANVVRPGTKLLVTISLPGGEVKIEGRVMWGKKVQPAFLQRVPKAGMGVNVTGFLAGEELYNALCDELEYL